VQSRGSTKLIFVFAVLASVVLIGVWLQRSGSSQDLATLSSDSPRTSPEVNTAADDSDNQVATNPKTFPDRSSGQSHLIPRQTDAGQKETALPAGIASIVDNLPHTRLSAAEAAEAIDVFARERAMWAKLRSLTGKIEISLLAGDGDQEYSTVSLQGQVDLQIVDETDPEKKKWWPFRNILKISDVNNGWTFSSDGTSEGTVLNCENQVLAASLQPLLNTLTVQNITFPQLALIPAYSDDLIPYERSYPKDEAFKVMPPWRNPDAENESGSFFFQNIEYDSNGITPKLVFENGHLHELASKQIQSKAYFNMPVESNGFWFPTEITVQRGSEKQRLKFSDIEVNKG